MSTIEANGNDIHEQPTMPDLPPAPATGSPTWVREVRTRATNYAMMAEDAALRQQFLQAQAWASVALALFAAAKDPVSY